MERRQGVSVLLLTLIVLSGVVPLTLSWIPTTSTPTLAPERTAAADGESLTTTVPVMEDEAVASSEPDTNFDGNLVDGGLFVGVETGESVVTRSWLKFNLQHLPRGISIKAASLCVFLNEVYTYFGDEDIPIGAYYSNNDWTSTTITWNTQLTIAADPSDIIDSPADPDMFVPKNWYSWDVTSDAQLALSNEGVLTEVLRAVNESGTEVHAFKYFMEREYSYTNSPYLVIEYTAPTLDTLQVDGWSSAPQIDYIQNSEPTLSWDFSDDDAGDSQKHYEVDIRTGATGTGSSVYHVSQTDIETVHNAGTIINLYPFNVSSEVRYQMKIDSSLIPRNGILDKIYIQCSSTSGELILENLEVYMLGVASTADLTADFASNYDGGFPTCVLSGETVRVPIVDSWIVFDLEDSFMVSDKVDLLAEFRFTNNTGTLTRINRTTTIAGNSVAYSYDVGAYHDTSADWLYTRLHNIKLEYASVEVYGAGGLTNSYPFAQSEARMQWKYNKSMIASEGLIDRIFFGVYSLTSDFTLENLSIYLVETPLEGFLNENFQDNYGGVTPTLVFQSDEYSPRNMGRWLVFDVDNTFYYSNEHDLLVEIIFDAKVGTGASCRFTNYAGGYRAYNITDSHSSTGGNSSSTYEFSLEFINNEQSISIESPSPLVNGTQYYYRVRACDGLGIWTSWDELPFRYNKIVGIPTWDNLVVNPAVARVGSPVTVSIDVVYFLGINEVSLEFAGSNHTMSHVGDTYSYTWSPSASGIVNFTVYMESFTGDFNTATGSFTVQQSIIPGIDDTTLIIILAVIGVVLVVSAVVCIKKRK